MSVYASDAAAAERFYAGSLGAMKGADPQDTTGVRYYLSPMQFVEVLPLPAEHGISRMARVAYATSDAAGVRAYLAGHGAEHLSEMRSAADGSRWFEAKDPEGNEVEVYQHGRLVEMGSAAPIGSRIIHVGYLVHSRTAEDAFYKSLLGFRAYWYGAMKPDAVDWVSQQVPDGYDWLEYMMVGDGSTTPLARGGCARAWGAEPFFDRRAEHGEGGYGAAGGRPHEPAARRPADGQRRQVAGEPVRSGWDTGRADGVSAGDEALLLGVYGGEPKEVARQRCALDRSTILSLGK